MRRSIVGGLLIVVFALSTVKADIVPSRPQPTPSPPPGPSKAVIRGVTVVQGYGYWEGRRWLTYISECAASQPACKGKDLHNCLIIEVNGQENPGGNIAFLQNQDKVAGDRSMKLELRGCEVTSIELKP